MTTALGMFNAKSRRPPGVIHVSRGVVRNRQQQPRQHDLFVIPICNGVGFGLHGQFRTSGSGSALQHRPGPHCF
jgi:hypothetical protein